MNGKQIKGLPVIGIAEGATLGTVEGVYVDVDARKQLGFVVDCWASATELESVYLDPSDIRSIGVDAVMATTAPCPACARTGLAATASLNGRAR